MPPKLELRPYQQHIGDLARKGNIIVCLPTGSGKTLIAAYLMTTEEISSQVYRQNKKVIFLVNTVQLANQQAAYIEANSGLKTICVTGGSSTNEWENKLRFCQVVVITSQLAHDKLAHGFLKFDNIALFVFDECHHVSKSHPMKKIMELYKKYAECSLTVPRILGLTASIVKTAKSGSITPAVVSENIKIIEKVLFAKAVTYHDLDELVKYSTKPELIIVQYCNESRLSWGNILDGFINVERVVSNRLMHQERAIFRLVNEARANVGSLPHFSVNSLFTNNDSNDLYRNLINTLEDFKEIYESLGPWAAADLAVHRIAWLETQFHGLDQVQIAVVNAVITQYLLFRAKVIKLSEKSPIEDLVSHKAWLLLQNLQVYRGKQGTSDDLLGLVFCKRRSCAIALNSLLQKFGAEYPEQFGFIKSAVVTGTNNTKRECLQTRVTQSKQKETLQMFREHKLNLIICTTVLEEGIDVPECNLVVRFDPLEVYTSYIQSMGRARKRGGQYHVFVSQHSYLMTKCEISKFMTQQQSINAALLRQLDSYTILMDDSDEDEDEELNDFAPFGVTGPKITPSSAIQLVNRFCQRPIGDQQLKVFAWYATENPRTSFSKRKYRGFVWIQDNPYIKGYVEGPLTTSIQNAKKSAYLQVCKKLFEAGALDDHLFPK